jgi:hypothetical protein
MRQLPLAARRQRRAHQGQALSGGRVFSTPAFVVTTSNITPDVENRDRKLERSRDIIAYLRTVPPLQ